MYFQSVSKKCQKMQKVSKEPKGTKNCPKVKKKKKSAKWANMSMCPNFLPIYKTSSLLNRKS